MDEFLDAYSDDQIYIALLERLVNIDEVEGLAPPRIRYSSYCRLWAVMMVGAIEMMIKQWHKHDRLGKDIAEYLNKENNGSKTEKLKQALSRRYIKIDDNNFQDLLAIKYIRNAYIHGDWKFSAQKKYVSSRGFPDNLMGFEEPHFRKMQKVYEEIMKGLAFAKTYNDIHSETLGGPPH